MTAPLISTLIALILRQCIDCEDDSLRQSFEDMINNTCRGCPISMLEATSRKNQMVLKRYQKDPKVSKADFNYPKLTINLSAFFVC
jgi:hypothetical protein